MLAFLERLQSAQRDFLSLEAKQSNNKKEKSQEDCLKTKQTTTIKNFHLEPKGLQIGGWLETHENNHSSWGLGAPSGQ